MNEFILKIRVNMFYYRAVIGDAALGGAGAGAVILTLLAILKSILIEECFFCLKILTMQSSLVQQSEAHSQFPLSQMNPA